MMGSDSCCRYLEQEDLIWPRVSGKIFPLIMSKEYFFFPMQVKQDLSQKMNREETQIHSCLLLTGWERHSKRCRKGPVHMEGGNSGITKLVKNQKSASVGK